MGYQCHTCGHYRHRDSLTLTRNYDRITIGKRKGYVNRMHIEYLSGLVFSGRTWFIRLCEDQSKRRVFGDVHPGPVDEDDYFAAHIQDEHQMQKHPYKPGKISFEAGKWEIDHCLVSANGCHGTKVLVFVIHRYLSPTQPLKIFC